MPIVNHFEKDNEIYYTITEKDSPVEEIRALQLLASRPLLIELYEYQHNVDIEKRIISTIDTNEEFPKRMQMMIIDYFEAEHYEVGMQLIENLYGTGKKPPFALLVSLVNMILKSKKKIRKRQQLKQHWLFCKRAHSILIDMLYLFGPSIYNPLWNQFKYFELVSIEKAKNAEDDDYEILDTKELEAYSDFWNFTDKLLNVEANDIDSKCRRLILDLFVNILKYDLKSRMNNEIKVADSIFVRTLKKDAICRISKFNQYLKILLKSFPQKDEHEFHLTSDIFNMLITVACFDNIATMNDLVMQTYGQFQEMNVDTCVEFMQIIQYPIFLILVLDKSLADIDTSYVKEEYRVFRNVHHIPLDLRKVLLYVLYTIPNNISSLEAIYHHVSIVSKYSMSVFSTLNVSRQKKDHIVLPESQLEFLLTNHCDVTSQWEALMENLISQVNQNTREDLEMVEKIRWAMKLTILTITEFF